MKNCIIALLCLLPCLASTAFAVYPQSKALDDGNLTFFVLNTGSFGFDPERTRSGFSGLYYPGSSFRGIMGGGGIWIAGKKGSEWYLTISGDESEFVPGPMNAQGEPVDTLFRLYKITRGEDFQLNDDYRNWPAAFGAPVDAFGRPLISGAQTMFTMFNDGDTASHVFAGFSNGKPLGVEVRMNTHMWDNDYQFADTMYSQIVELDFEIINRSGEPIESCIVSMYIDADIGYSEDDLFGSSEELQCAYIYPEANFDSDYGSSPPTVGVTFLGNEAASATYYYGCRSIYPECIRVDTLPELLNLLNGFNPLGQPFVNPTTARSTRFPYGGDPFRGTGWLDTLSRDYRILLNVPPVDLADGDTTHVRMALIVAQGTDYKDGVRRFLETTAIVRSLFNADTTKPALSVSPESSVHVVGRDVVTHDWGGRFLRGGADIAHRFLGITKLPGGVGTATLGFTPQGRRTIHRFVERNSVLVYDGAVQSLPGINVMAGGAPRECFFVDTNHDGTLGDDDGKMEPLILTDLGYGAMSSVPAGREILYYQSNLTFAVHLDQSLYDLPSTTIEFSGAQMFSEFKNLPDTIVVHESNSEAPSEHSLRFQNSTGFLQTINVHFSDPQAMAAYPQAFDLRPGQERYVSILSRATGDTDESHHLMIDSYSFRDAHWVVPIRVVAAGLTTSGDADNDGALGFSDLLSMVGILYRNSPILVPIRQIDSNCDQRFNITDLVAYLNYLYSQSDLPCSQL